MSNAQTKDRFEDISQGMTMEIPYKVFAKPVIFWNMIRRNIGIGVPAKSLVFNQNGSNEVLKKIIVALNEFTDRPTFNAKGLKNDGVEPSDQAYKEWTESLRFMITIMDRPNAQNTLTIGILSKDPWTSLTVKPVSTSFISFYQNNKGEFILSPSVEEEKLDVKEKDISSFVQVKPFHLWNHSTDMTTGTVPTILTADMFAKGIEEFVEGLRSKINSVDPEAEKILEKLHSELLEQLTIFEAYNGGVLAMMQASLFVRSVPRLDGKLDFFVGMSAQSDYSLNHYSKFTL